VQWNHAVTAAIFDGTGSVRPIPDYNFYELLCQSEKDGVPLATLASRLASPHKESLPPIIPLQPREVWACGCTYESSASFRDAEHGTREGFYAQVYRDARPEIFFKGTARFCTGPGQSIGLRPDSTFTAPEPELAVILGNKGRAVGYTIANDVSAWDIERENPLYLPQSKLYSCACALGPVIVTADELTNPYQLNITCTVEREGAVIFSGETNTSSLNRTIETLVEFLMRSNPVPAGSVLLTGTGIIAPQQAALAPGDVVTIRIPEIGELRNSAVLV
jgi:2-dehydro-3-deoxy-D-arabinonate dehydratase